ncbi:MAG: hypothetical protein M0R80_17620 [Proteobacteria bacterium]|jgi:hypothetical protein|nr:hypothetical protein [Pseudomonadota bacterium]
MTEEQVKKEYIDTNRTMKEASTILGVTPPVLCRFMKKHKMRSKASNWKGIAWNSGKTYKDDPRILAKDKHPKYITGNSYESDFHRLKKILLPDKCSCGEEGKILHHIDKNKKNNSVNNIQILCPSCHTTFHNKERGVHKYTFNCKWCGKEKTIYSNKKYFPACCSLSCKAKYQYHISKVGYVYEHNKKNS